MKLNIYARVCIQKRLKRNKKENVHARVSRSKKVCSQAYTVQNKEKKNAQASIRTEGKLVAIDAVVLRK